MEVRLRGVAVLVDTTGVVAATTVDGTLIQTLWSSGWGRRFPVAIRDAGIWATGSISESVLCGLETETVSTEFS